MNATFEPATELQLNQLRRFNYHPDRVLSRQEAAQLLFELEHSRTASLSGEVPGIPQQTEHEAFHLRKVVEHEKHSHSDEGLKAAVLRRQQFWADTFREPTKMQIGWPQILDLYRAQGCRFIDPTHAQVQEILDALDVALPHWDRDHPELFYQTLELNFPELVRNR